MYTFHSLKYAAVLLPALAIGVPMANAGDEECDCSSQKERTASVIESDRDAKRNNQRDNLRANELKEPHNNQLGKTEGTTQARLNQTNKIGANHNAYVDKMPDRGYHSDTLVGAEVMNRRNNESVGEVSNLVLDESGQVVAVIVSVGGVMGIGEHDVAISWDQIQRKADGDDIVLSVNMTEESLEDAPRYSSNRNLTTE